MTRLTTKQGFRVAYLAFLLASVHVCTAQQVTAPILDSEIVSLQRELSEQNVSRASATSRRRAYKGIVRSGDEVGVGCLVAVFVFPAQIRETILAHRKLRRRQPGATLDTVPR